MYPFVSIVIPIYNSALYLKRCLDSVVNQTLKNIEIICIDDNSTDDTSKILKEFSVLDSRLKIQKNSENKGEAISRNLGMEIATGEYFGFVDSDDFLDLDFLEQLYSLSKEADSEITKGNVRQIDYNRAEEIINMNDKITDNKYNFSCYFWSALYRRRFIMDNHIQFTPRLICGSDLTFLIQAVCLSAKIATTGSTFYNYFRRRDSMDSQFLNLEKIESIVTARKFIINYINANEINNDEYFIAFNYCINGLIHLMNKVEPVDKNRIGQLITDNIFYLWSICRHKTKLPNRYYRYYYKYLQNNDNDGLTAWIKKDSKERLADEFRFRISSSFF